MKTRNLILLLGALLAAFVGAAVWGATRDAGHTAVITQDGQMLRRIDLDAVAEPFSFTLRDANGHENTVQVEPGRIRMLHANCPDQVCVRFGWLESGSTPIVCLPARLTIRLEDAGPDAVAG